jgi:hypothetical protein
MAKRRNCEATFNLAGQHRSDTRSSASEFEKIRGTIFQAVSVKISTHIIMQRGLTYPSKIQVLQVAHCSQQAAETCEFCRDFLHFVQQYTLDYLWFSDEASFRLNESMSKRSTKFRASKYPHRVVQMFVGPQLQNEIVSITLGAGHVDAAFSQQDVACPRTADTGWDVLQDVCGNRFVESIAMALLVWVAVATTFTGHGCLQLFPLRLPQSSCLSDTVFKSSRRKLSLCRRDHVA